LTGVVRNDVFACVTVLHGSPENSGPNYVNGKTILLNSRMFLRNRVQIPYNTVIKYNVKPLHSASLKKYCTEL